LTRYLQLSLDLFRDLQSSLQPRLHLEIGLLRMVHAGKLLPIEEALAGLRGVNLSGTAPRTVPPKPIAAPPVTMTPPPSATGAPATGDLRERLYAALLEAKLAHPADALQHSELTESTTELVFTTPKMYQLYVKEPAFE